MTESHDACRLRAARAEDLPALVALLADDPLGATREAPEATVSSAYTEAFGAIDGDPNHRLIVAEDDRGVAGLLQLSFIPGLTYQGGWRAQIEGVRVAADRRGAGLGAHLIRSAIEEARARGCRLVQLTSDKRRPDALAFYERLGFSATHEGFKFHL